MSKKKTLGQTYHENAVKQTLDRAREENELWQQQYMTAPPEKDRSQETPELIEKENQEGLRMPGPFAEATNVVRKTYTGFRFTEHESFKSMARSDPFKESQLADWEWTTVPWYARFLGLLRLPYDLVKFIVTGRLILIPWPWRW